MKTSKDRPPATARLVSALVSGALLAAALLLGGESPAEAAHEIVFSGTIRITGAVNVAGKWTDDAEAWYRSCSSWAHYKVTKSTPVGRHVPGPSGVKGQTVDGHWVSLLFVFTSYEGPGTYTHDIRAKSFSVDGLYQNPRSYRLHIDSNGSGSLTFLKATDILAPAGEVSGDESWTCH